MIEKVVIKELLEILSKFSMRLNRFIFESNSWKYKINESLWIK